MSKEGKLKALCVRLPEDLVRRLHAHAALEGRTAREIIKTLLEASLPYVTARPRTKPGKEAA
jgi:predicted DNA-binding protein